MSEERNKKLEAGKQKFAEFLKKKNSNDKKKRKRRTGSPISEMNELIINENMNPNHFMNGNSISDEICGNNDHQFIDESISSESNALHLNEALKQRDALINKLSQRLTECLQSRDDVLRTAESMALQIEQLKNQLKLFSSSLHSKSIEEQPILIDFECQTEWNENSSIEYVRRQSEHEVIGIGVNTFSAIMEDKSEQTVQKEYLCENAVQTDNDLLHRNCREELEKTKLSLVNEFTERERKTELALLEQVKRLEEQMKLDRQTYIDENIKLDNQIDSLKSRISDFERKRRQSKSEESDFQDDDIHTFKSRISEPSSPLQPYSPFLQNQSENDSHMTSRSPPHNHLQNRNNWYNNHQTYSAPLDADTESCWHLQAAQTNSRLLHVLSDIVKTFLDTEHDIQKKLEEMGFESNGNNKEDMLQGFTSLVEDNMERLSESNEMCEDGPDLTPSSNLLFLTPPSTFMSGQSEVEVEDDVVLGASRRLRSSVDQMLKLLSEIVAAHQEHDFNSILKRNEELVSELNEECSRRDKLTAQLLQIEDRVKTLEKEKTTLSEKVIDYNEAKRQMETMRIKIDEYEAEREKCINDNKRLEKEKSTFAEGLPQLQKKLVNDNDVLNSDVRQLQQEKSKLLQKIHALTLESEQLRSERDDILDEKRKECEDFEAQIDDNEKNLLSYKKFIDEQTHEREIERDEFNKELVTLTLKLKEKDKNETKLRSRLEEMENQITCLTEDKDSKKKQFNDINSQLKCANHEISELRSVIKQMERESDKCNQLERQLRSKVNDLNEALELQIKINEEAQQDVFTTAILERITSKTHQLQNTLGSPDFESESEDTSIECSYNDVRQLSERLNALNECIDKLLVQNNSLKAELERAKKDDKNDYQELVKEKDSLDRNLTEIMRSNEILQEELNSKHLQLSAFKSRLESSIESSDMKYMVEELQNKLIAEEQKCNALDFEIVSLKRQIDDNNNKTLQLIDEVNTLKRQIKTLDSDNCSLVRENDELRLKISSKDAILVAVRQSAEERVNDTKHLNEQIEVFKSKIDSILSEKSIIMKENEELKTRINTSEQKVVSLKQQINEKFVKESKLVEMNESLSKNLRVIDSKNENLTKDNNELKSKLCSVDAILLSLNQQVEEKNNKALELIDRVDSLTNKLKLVDSEKAKSFKENEELKSQLSQTNQIIDQLKLEIENQKIQSLRLLEEINSLKYKLKKLESEKESLLKENSSLRAKLNSADDVLIVLKQQLEDRNHKVMHLNKVIDDMNLKFYRLESETDNNRKENEKINVSSKQSLHTHSEKYIEDDEKLNGVTNQFLWKLKRVISHKNALIYQKKYLLHVLGGFQLTERATLALLANMNVTVDDESPAFQSGRNRFRSVVYSIIAISRMKSLVHKWKYRNYHKSKPTVTKTVSTNSLGATNESQTNSTLQEFVNRLQRLHDTLGLRSGQI